ncbi:hypothetical protein [Nocardia cyriacigeorgica]|uniref:hypothetical protein n=1 Tax=Nocardia cyriacigeorgica TaxID=135487 RepID=UPI001E577238|nr:hypothetical protein [Nocardia cyriacigeorgica]
MPETNASHSAHVNRSDTPPKDTTTPSTPRATTGNPVGRGLAIDNAVEKLPPPRGRHLDHRLPNRIDPRRTQVLAVPHEHRLTAKRTSTQLAASVEKLDMNHVVAAPVVLVQSMHAGVLYGRSTPAIRVDIGLNQGSMSIQRRMLGRVGRRIIGACGGLERFLRWLRLWWWPGA